jgi:hypothetical protein
MRRIAFVIAVLALAVAAPATGAPKPKPPKPGKLTGANNGGKSVTLAEDPFPYGDGFVNAATATTDGNGNYTFPRRVAPSNRNYRVTIGADQAFTGVRVRMRVSFSVGDSTPNRGQRVGFTGFVAPKHDGRMALIQRLSSVTGSWGTVKRTLLRATTGNRSRYSTTLVIFRTGTYRVRVGADGDHITGTSRTRRLTVG